MRIGILTASRTNNIGTDLQALAMQLIFQNSGYVVELIDYKCDKLENSRKFFYPKTITGFLNIPWKIHNNRIHNRFRKKYFNFSPFTYDKTTIRNNDYDIVIVGSDQIWNLQITGNDLSFFLPYTNRNQKKYSYAASLGRTDITDWERNFNLSKLLEDFDKVSVRENSSIPALNKIGIKSRFDLDPLLMIERQVWDQLKEKPKERKKYVFVYIVDRTLEAIEFAKKYAKDHGLKVIFFGNLLRPIKGIKVIRFSTIQKWIGFLSDAELIVTNSYHCLSFAIIFQKKFLLFWLSEKQSNSRLKNLLDIIGIENYVEKQICNPNWKKAYELLNDKRKDSHSYIESMLSEQRK